MARPGPGAAADPPSPGASPPRPASGDDPGRGPHRFGPFRLTAPRARTGPTRAYVAEIEGPLGTRSLELAILPGSLGRDPRMRRRLEEHWPRATRLAHPHLVRTHEIGRLGDLYYALEEPAGAVDLGAVLATAGPLDPVSVAHLGAAVAEALHHVHRRLRGAHGEVTPARIRLDARGRVRLDPPGLAPPVPGEDRAFGDPDWAAPEQRFGDGGGPPADLFGLGAVLHACLTGLPPGAFAEGPEARAFEGLEGVPHGLRVALADTLAVDPRERAGSAEGLALRLRRWLRTAAPDLDLDARWAARVDAVDPGKLRAGPPPSPGAGAARVLARSDDLEAFLGGALGPDSFGPPEAPPVSAPPSTLPPVPGPPRVPSEADRVRPREPEWPAPVPSTPPRNRWLAWRRRAAWGIAFGAVIGAALLRASCGGG